MSSPDSLIVGTRGSTLALWQAERVQEHLEADGHTVRLQQITTRGDQERDVPISQIDAESVFTKEIDRAMLRGEIDLAVHSLKDLPSQLPDGIMLAAVSERASPFDAFVAHPSWEGSLDALPPDATLATSSVRRHAQLKAWRPSLNIVPVRGNVDSRLDKLDASDWHGMVLAVAGLKRMGRAERIREAIDLQVMVPAVGQGALGITCRAEDEHLQAIARAAVHHRPAGLVATAERSFMQTIDGGCQVPTGCWGRFNDAGELVVDGCIAALDGTRLFRVRRTFPPEEAAQAGTHVAEELLEQGGDEVLQEMGFRA